MANFSERLVQLQSERNHLKKDIAKAIGISVMAYYRYETGERLPPSDILSKFADYFEVSTDYLLGRSNYWVDAEGNIKGKTPPDIF